MRPYESPVPKNLREIEDLLNLILTSAPKCLDNTGYFPGRNTEKLYSALNEGLLLLRNKLGEDLYLTLKDMSDRSRAYFEADPDKTTGDTRKGCTLIQDMEDLLQAHRRKR